MMEQIMSNVIDSFTHKLKMKICFYSEEDNGFTKEQNKELILQIYGDIDLLRDIIIKQNKEKKVKMDEININYN